MPLEDSKAQQEERDSSFLARTQLMKSHGPNVYSSPPNFLFPSIKEFSFPCCGGNCMWLTVVADPEL